MYLFCPRNVHVPVFCFLYLERANAAMAMAAPPTWLSHDERPPRAFRKARVLPLKLRSSGCAMRTIARCGNKRNHGAWKWDKNGEKNGGWDFMGIKWDQMKNWQTLMGMSSYGFSTKKNIMWCFVHFSLVLNENMMNCSTPTAKAPKFGQLLQFVCTNEHFLMIQPGMWNQIPPCS